MSNETDLDWLARNVHEWPAGDHQPWCYVYMVFGGAMKASGSFLDAVAKPTTITKDQWLARRAELQDKPSWGGAPEWAEWLTQDKDGVWLWCGDEPITGERGWNHRAAPITQGGIGEAIGDWRDTLEKRPEEFKPFTSIEENQGQEMKQDNGWFERGELPPVGCLCLYVVSDRLSAEVEITAHAKFGLCFVLVGTSGESYVSKTAELHRFRPIRTERDVLLEIIASNLSGTTGQVADAIIAAGFKLEAK